MNWAYHLAGSAQADFATLPVNVQERVLDALETLCAGADSRFFDVDQPEEITVAADDNFEIVRLRIAQVHARRVLVVVEIEHVVP